MTDNALDKLDMLVRLTHPDWAAITDEWTELYRSMLIQDDPQEIGDYLFKRKRIKRRLEASGLSYSLVQDFAENGFEDSTTWWRDNIIEIAKCSDNPTIQAALKEKSQ